jgi:hypothetical protein
MAQVVKQLPSKHKALRVQTPNCKKERKTERQNIWNNFLHLIRHNGMKLDINTKKTEETKQTHTE